jgi:hypothetical protein
MEIMLIIINAIFGIALWLSVVFNIRLIKKVDFYEQWILVFKTRIGDAFNAMRMADIRGSFEADDEVGISFRIIKANIDDLQKFTE